MQQSDSFEALGSAKPNSPDTGFRTYGTLLAYGVNAQGVHVGSKHGAGVYAESMLQSPGARASQAKSRSGVWGTGDHYGVYGASDLLYGVGGPQPQTDENSHSVARPGPKYTPERPRRHWRRRRRWSEPECARGDWGLRRD